MTSDLFLSRGFLAGLVFLIPGIVMCGGSMQYDIGTAARMGPGYFPLIISLLMIIVGLAIIIDAWRQPVIRVSFDTWRPLFFIVFSVIVFALTLEQIGLLLSVVLVVFISSLAMNAPNLLHSALLTGLLCFFSVGVFYYGLQLPLKLWVF
jgi:hypothetical protein